ncbi:hypothetical protein DSTSK_14070 [Desulforhabdus sp. TSK]|nr:hypothetical protein DSTSK_14070 [Desulforhabdus sp. TSK]
MSRMMLWSTACLENSYCRLSNFPRIPSIMAIITKLSTPRVHVNLHWPPVAAQRSGSAAARSAPRCNGLGDLPQNAFNNPRGLKIAIIGMWLRAARHAPGTPRHSPYVFGCLRSGPVQDRWFGLFRRFSLQRVKASWLGQVPESHAVHKCLHSRSLFRSVYPSH